MHEILKTTFTTPRSIPSQNKQPSKHSSACALLCFGVAETTSFLLLFFLSIVFYFFLSFPFLSFFFF
uniref:Uncharacterized protein n=1 Tax=Rhizophora mucronata TaxID=61149 RepID=A0A2P2LTK2_RHIMU